MVTSVSVIPALHSDETSTAVLTLGVPGRMIVLVLMGLNVLELLRVVLTGGLSECFLLHLEPSFVGLFLW